MELIEGEPLDTYAEERGLGLSDRLELFCRICEAMCYAHRRGVVHRDLKPANILVDTAGQPKILDFGIAKADELDLRVTRPGTGEGLLVGTITHMSPEQLTRGGDEVDTRTDVYALGVILFQLVSGELPYRVQSGHPLHVLHSIVSEGCVPLRSVVANAPRDLEAIVDKALERHPTMRYQGVAELLDDVQRFRAGRPVAARSGGSLYRFGKWVRRRRVALASAGLVLLVLVSSALAIHAWSRKEALARERQRLQLRDRLYELCSVGVRQGLDAWEIDHLDVASDLIDALGLEKDGQPKLVADAVAFLTGIDQEQHLDALVMGYCTLLEELELGGAAPAGRRPLRLPPLPARDDARRDGLGPYWDLALQVLREVDKERSAILDAYLAWRDGGEDTFDALLERALAKPKGDRSAGAELDLLAFFLMRTRGEEQADRVYAESLGRSFDSFWAHFYRSRVALERREFERAVEHASAALALEADSHFAKFHYATTLVESGRYEEGLPILRLLHHERPDASFVGNNLAKALNEEGDMESALRLYRELVDRHPDDPEYLFNLAATLARRGIQGEDEALLAEAFELFGELTALDPPFERAFIQWGVVLLQWLEPAEAEAVFRDGLEAGFETAVLWFNLGLALDAEGDRAGARAAFEQALELDPDYGPAHSRLGDIYEAEWQAAGHPGASPDATREYLLAAAGDPGDATYLLNLAISRAQEGRFSEAVKLFTQGIEEHPLDGHLWSGLSVVLADVAFAFAERAAELAPANYQIQKNLMDFCVLWEDLERAAEIEARLARLEADEKAAREAAEEASGASEPERPR